MKRTKYRWLKCPTQLWIHGPKSVLDVNNCFCRGNKVFFQCSHSDDRISWCIHCKRYNDGRVQVLEGDLGRFGEGYFVRANWNCWSHPWSHLHFLHVFGNSACSSSMSSNTCRIDVSFWWWGNRLGLIPVMRHKDSFWYLRQVKKKKRRMWTMTVQDYYELSQRKARPCFRGVFWLPCSNESGCNTPCRPWTQTLQ